MYIGENYCTLIDNGGNLCAPTLYIITATMLDLVAQHSEMTGPEKIDLIQEKMKQLHKKWLELKTEVSSLERKKRRARRKVRECEQYIHVHTHTQTHTHGHVTTHTCTHTQPHVIKQPVSFKTTPYTPPPRLLQLPLPSILPLSVTNLA